jgi:hypothetical protein
MRTIYSLSIAALTMLSVAGVSAAQDKTPILNSLEVRQLVARGEPGDNTRLTAHFTALADRYTAEARRHTSMSTGFVGNPSRNLGAGMSTHCKRLADLNTQSADAARELAAYHGRLAGGGPATPPVGGAQLREGAGAPDPTTTELTALAAKASTATDHRLVEEYFLTLAKRYTGDADNHTATARAYRGLPRNPGNAMAAHCDRLAQLSREAASEATKAAAEHKALSGATR